MTSSYHYHVPLSFKLELIYMKYLTLEIWRNYQPIVLLVAHFEGKMLAHLERMIHDSLVIVVCGLDDEKLLGILRLPS